MDKNRPAPLSSDPVGSEHPAGPKDVSGATAGEALRRSRPEGADGYLDGRILIAMPGIGEPFERMIMIMCVHDEEQAMAIALNRPLEGLTVGGLLKRLGMGSDAALDGPVLFGGPVERSRGYVLHSDDYASANSTLPVAEGVALTDTREVLDALGDPSRRPSRALLALGYAGWGPGQLETELKEGVWLTCDPDEELIFGVDHEAKWVRALEKIGVSADRLSTQAGRA